MAPLGFIREAGCDLEKSNLISTSASFFCSVVKQVNSLFFVRYLSGTGPGSPCEEDGFAALLRTLPFYPFPNPFALPQSPSAFDEIRARLVMTTQLAMTSQMAISPSSMGLHSFVPPAQPTQNINSPRDVINTSMSCGETINSSNGLEVSLNIF